MDRFQDGNGSGEKPLSPLIITDFAVAVAVVEDQRRYALMLEDGDGDHVEVVFGSQAMAQLAVLIAKAAIGACDDDWLTMLMVLLTETPEQSVEKLFESGHAKDNLED